MKVVVHLATVVSYSRKKFMTLSKGLTELGNVGDVEPSRELLPGVNVVKLFSLILLVKKGAT